jgi:hypothetical protein
MMKKTVYWVQIYKMNAWNDMLVVPGALSILDFYQFDSMWAKDYAKLFRLYAC